MMAAEFYNEVARFWSKVDKSGACWLWTGEKNNQGYGRFVFWHEGGRSRSLAHRLSAELNGTLLAEADVLLHSCDTPACVNPAHLTVGTQALNMQDAMAKGRTNLTGLSAHYSRSCKTCEVVFTGRPNRRYCDLHQPKSKRRAA